MFDPHGAGWRDNCPPPLHSAIFLILQSLNMIWINLAIIFVLLKVSFAAFEFSDFNYL
jgi:hypothetical protein